MKNNNYQAEPEENKNGSRQLDEIIYDFILNSSDHLALAIRQAIKDGNVLELKKRTPLSEWIDGSKVMIALGISQRTLQTLRDSGKLLYSQINGKIYYKRSDIEDMLDNSYLMRRIKNIDGYGSVRK